MLQLVDNIQTENFAEYSEYMNLDSYSKSLLITIPLSWKSQ